MGNTKNRSVNGVKKAKLDPGANNNNVFLSNGPNNYSVKQQTNSAPEEEKIDNISNKSTVDSGSSGSTSGSPSLNYTLEEQKINEKFLEVALNNNLGTVSELLKNPKLDVNVLHPKYKATALIMAVQGSKKEMIELLLSHPEIDLDIKSSNNHGPLTYAAFSRNLDVIETLLSHKTISSEQKEATWTTALLATSFANDLQDFQTLLKHHPDKYFIKNHALEIFAEAANIIDGTLEGSIQGDFLEFVINKLVEQTSPKQALEICIKAIPSFGGFEPTYKYIFTEDIFIPSFKKKLTNQEIKNGFNEVINDLNNYDPITSSDLARIKDYLQRWHYLDDSDTQLNGDHITT